jgi:D-lactate dehydrogenase
MKTGELLEAILPKERIKTRLVDLVSYASDAGFYYLRPKAVVRPVKEEEIVALFQFSHQHKIPLTFRTGGTSLSGQSISDGILVDLSQYWNNIKIEAAGQLVRLQPGITGATVNAYLKKYKRKIGPDPSSIDSAMIGGILSNNSSGMCCGVRLNSYHTTKYIRFILPDGKEFSTERKDDYARFETECPVIYQTVLQARQEVIGNPVLQDRIRKKYETKNTVGYSLNALIDFTHPLDILAHLLVGAEGTLAFIAEAVMETIPDYPCKATSLMYFENIYEACRAIVPLTLSGAQAVELMDRASLLSIENIKGVPERLKTLPPSAAALLVEFHAHTDEELQEQINRFLSDARMLSLLEGIEFTKDPVQQTFLWKLRKGMFPAVGAVRASGTAVILEDIAFPVQQLGDAILDLQTLFARHGYHNAIIFGHAKDGNIHFVVTQSFNTSAEVERYDLFMRDVVDLVVKKYDGTLKAEHGTGRNMAPFVETEWGGDAYRVMEMLKKAIDPQNLLNPDVIINADKNAHIRNLKALPAVEQEVDKCIECGYCEHVCPSRNITLTPRRRIVVRREMALMKSRGEHQLLKELVKEYQYDGLDTCAVDGLCATACPVDINTGDLVKRLRRESHHSFSNNVAVWVARHFKTTASLVLFALRTGNAINKIFGASAMRKLTGGIKKIIPAFPLWSNELQVPAKFRANTNTLPGTSEGQQTVVYLPTCISRVMGGTKGKKSVRETFMSVSEKAQVHVITLADVNASCCGQLFSSKGFSKAYAIMCNETIAKLWNATSEGKFPVVLDVSSCTYTLQHCRPVLDSENQLRFDKLTIIDSIDYLHDYILPAVKIKEKKAGIVLHPVCSLEKMGLKKKLLTIASQCAGQVDVPLYAGCCGMAGDRGFLFPELTASATAPEAAQVKQRDYQGYYSSAKTCEMAMTDAVGASYESVLYMVDECL